MSCAAKDFEEKLIKRASYLSFIVAFFIIIVKAFAWLRTDSPSIFASFVDSILDITASFANIVAIHYALQPADNEHRFGHGKAEDIAVLTQSSLFLISGFAVFVVAVKKILFPIKIDNSNEGILAIIISIFLTLILVSYQRYVIYKTQSSIIKADNLHFGVDLVTNIATIISLYASVRFDLIYLDPVFAVFIAIYIIYGALSLLRGSFNNLMDKELDAKKKNIIIDIIKQHPEVTGFHDLRTRHSGNKMFVQFHLEMDGEFSLLKAHDVAEEIENQIINKFPKAEVIIHQDPNNIKEKVYYRD